MISQRPFCADLDTIDTPCPEGPVEIQQAVLLLPGEYSVSFEAEARAVISTGGGPMESSAKIAYTLVFWGAQLDISSTSWSAVKQLYR